MKRSIQQAQQLLRAEIARCGCVETRDGNHLINSLRDMGHVVEVGRGILGTTYILTPAGRAALEQGS